MGKKSVQELPLVVFSSWELLNLSKSYLASTEILTSLKSRTIPQFLSVVAVSTKSFILKYLACVTLFITVVANWKCCDYGYSSNGISIYTSIGCSLSLFWYQWFFWSLMNGYSWLIRGQLWKFLDTLGALRNFKGHSSLKNWNLQ